jgi:polysaccharide deacetylase family protein (PEP-CTERM system associated)
MQNILTIDVEDWFHILEVESTPTVQRWDALESRVERNFLSLLDEIDDAQASVSCFFLGWIAERYPHLVREASARGHEVASHGYAHQLVYCQSRAEFAEDIKRSKGVLEDILGTQVLGYRAPGFSITRDTSWAFDEIAAAGFEYDSSVFPARRGHGGMEGGELAPYWIETNTGPLLEIPVSVIPVLGQRLCAFGGGYLRLAPYPIIDRLSKAVNKSGRPVIYYLHPREIDPDHPRIDMGMLRRFKSYVNLHSTRPKLRKLLRDQDLVTFRGWIEQNVSVNDATP